MKGGSRHSTPPEAPAGEPALSVAAALGDKPWLVPFGRASESLAVAAHKLHDRDFPGRLARVVSEVRHVLLLFGVDLVADFSFYNDRCGLEFLCANLDRYLRMGHQIVLPVGIRWCTTL